MAPHEGCWSCPWHLKNGLPPMRLIKVAAAVLNQTALAWDDNKANILDALNAAREQRRQHLVSAGTVHHRLWLRGRVSLARCSAYGPAGPVGDRARNARHGRLAGASTAAPRRAVQHRLSGCGRADPGLCRPSRNLANEGIHYEPRWFNPGRGPFRATRRSAAIVSPGRPRLRVLATSRLGFEICEDAWVGDRPGVELARRNVDMILNPSASHFRLWQASGSRRFVLEGSRALCVSYVYANLLGNEAGRAIYDGDAMLASGGQMLAVGPRFSFCDYHLTTGVVDVDVTRMSDRGPVLASRFGVDDDPSGVSAGLCVFRRFNRKPSDRRRQLWERGTIKEEEFLGPSPWGCSTTCGRVARGGSSSRSAAGPIRPVSRAGGVARATGHQPSWAWKGWSPSSAYIRLDWPTAADHREVVHRLLTCVYQATRNSSQTTLAAAATVADALGATLSPLRRRWHGPVLRVDRFRSHRPPAVMAAG